jgi:hypothetical protein
VDLQGWATLPEGKAVADRKKKEFRTMLGDHSLILWKPEV